MKTSLITVEPGQRLQLDTIDADATGDASKDEARERRAALREELSDLQVRLFAENQRSLLLVFQAMDTGGKDGAVKDLLTGINPAGIHVTSFKAPTPIELSHDFLWRIHVAAPSKGIIGVWNRSHYEDVLVPRVHKWIEPKVWEDRYKDINSFEDLLSDAGTKIVKFYLHISKSEQKKRLQKRLDNPEKNWKFNAGDLKERAHWSDYMAAYQDLLRECSTKSAPWHIVPSNNKWARDIAILECVVSTLRAMNPQYPKVDFDATKIVVE